LSGFVIFALPVARGILGVAPMPGRGGHYAEDIAHLTDWRPALVVTLATEAERDAAGAGGLGADLQHSGTRWFPFPVADFGVPGAAQEAGWHALGRPALAALQGGGRVLIHCKGGRGRSGMAALRLMIAAGEAPAAALERLRAVCPGAVETREQFDWACKGADAGDTKSPGP
jgi:hypothetical protein